MDQNFRYYYSQSFKLGNRMGCGTSINDNEVKAPNSVSEARPETASQQPENHGKFLSERKNVDLKEIKTEKSIINGDNSNSTANLKVQTSKQEEVPPKQANARIYLFGESKQQRKIIQFEALPTPHIQILLSRTHSLPPVKYQPTEVILEESQELTSSHLYISNSHPPYNYMYATFIKHNTIFLCGGVNFNFDNVSNEAFLYYVKDEPINLNTPHKNDKSGLIGNSFKKQRRIGNNLMGSKFERLSMMKSKRYSHMGVFFRAGKLSYVYIFGGRTENDETLNKCQKYSIQQNKWTDIAPLNAPRSTGFAIILNKKIYVFGGYTKQGKRSKKIERYNPTFDSWDVLNFKLHKGIETGIILPCPSSSEILIVGGNVQFGAIKSVIRLNFQTETYCWDSDLKKERLLQKGLALLEQNTAYVLGGDFEDNVEKYSYKDKTWKIVNNLTYGECVSPDDINAFTLAQQTVELSFDTDTSHNASTNKQQKQNDKTLSSEYKYVFGSDDYPCIYEINTSKWVLKKKNVPLALRLRCFMTATKIKDGKIFLAGGIDCYFEKPSRAAYIYYTGTNKAIEIAKMKQKKYAFAACTYKNFVYIFGGQDGKQGKVLSTAQKYDINEDKWIELPEMPQERTFSKAVLTPNNKILLIGGTDCLYQTVCKIDMYDPDKNTWSTFEMNFPLACEIKFVDFTGKAVVEKQKKTGGGEFEFLENSSIHVEIEKKEVKEEVKQKVEENNSKIQNLSALKMEQVSEFCLMVFGYNSYRKQDQAYLLSLSTNPPQHISFDQKSHKLYPYSLTFTLKPTQNSPADQKGKEAKNQQTIYYFISNKGVFKWQESTKTMNSQIVINQMHMLQMPLEKFSIA